MQAVLSFENVYRCKNLSERGGVELVLTRCYCEICWVLTEFASDIRDSNSVYRIMVLFRITKLAFR